MGEPALVGNSAICGVAGSTVCSDFRANSRGLNRATCSSSTPTLDVSAP